MEFEPHFSSFWRQIRSFTQISQGANLEEQICHSETWRVLSWSCYNDIFCVSEVMEVMELDSERYNVFMELWIQFNALNICIFHNFFFCSPVQYFCGHPAQCLSHTYLLCLLSLVLALLCIVEQQDWLLVCRHWLDSSVNLIPSLIFFAGAWILALFCLFVCFSLLTHTVPSMLHHPVGFMYEQKYEGR